MTTEELILALRETVKTSMVGRHQELLLEAVSRLEELRDGQEDEAMRAYDRMD
jgi:hypothetical protein